jgi:hypothetical protein
VSIEATLLLETADTIPTIVAKALPQSVRGRPGLKEPSGRATTQGMAGMAEQRQGQGLVGGPTCVPEARPQRDSEPTSRPYQHDEGDAIHRLTRLAGVDPRQPCHGGRKRFGNDRSVEAQAPPFPDQECATSTVQACVPGPSTLPPPRQAVVRHGSQSFSQRAAPARWAIIEPGGEVEPNQR